MKNGILRLGAACALIILLLTTPAGLVHAAPPVIQPVVINTILTSQFSPPSPDPAGLTYDPATGTLIISDSEVDEMPNLFAGKNIFITTLSGQLIDTFTTTTPLVRSFEPSGIAYNPDDGSIYISDDNRVQIFEFHPGSDDRFNTADDTVRSFSSSVFGNSDPEGITYDSWHKHLILTSGVAEEIYDIDPGPNGVFEGSGDDVVTHFDTTVLGLRDPEAVEFNRDTGNLFILSALSNKIGEVTLSGKVLRYIDITGLNGLFESGLAYAPGSSNPVERHLYIVARGIDNGADPNENDGKLYEISFPLLPSTPIPTTSPTLPVTATGTPVSTFTMTDTPTATSTNTLTSTPTSTLTNTSTPTPTATFTPTFTPTPSPTIGAPPDVLFADGFESGDLSAWTGSSTNGDHLAVTRSSALIGSYGLSASISTNTSMYVQYDHPGVEPHYRARFYFDLNSIVMAKSNSHLILYGYSNATTPFLRIELRRSASAYTLRPAIRDDTGTWKTSSYLTITDAPHFLEFDYRASSGADADNGFLTFWVDGVQRANLTGLDTDTRPLDFVRLGPLSGIDTGTRGTYNFDAFEARRFSYIGPALP